MKRILRFEVPVDDQKHTLMLSHYPVAVAAKQEDTVEFWVEHDDELSLFECTLQVFGTGQPLPENAIYLGTSQRISGLVWHLYDVG